MKKIFFCYVIGLHILLLYMFYNPYFLESQRWRFNLPDIRQNIKEQELYNDWIPLNIKKTGNNNLIVGSSHLRRFNHTNLVQKFINLSISGQTVETLYKNLSRLPFIDNIDQVIMLVGGNDILHNNRDAAFIFKKIRKIYQKFLSVKKFYLINFPPVGHSLDKKMSKRILKVNHLITEFCQEQIQCHLIDIHSKLLNNKGLLDEKYNAGDDLHLSNSAYMLLQKLINQALSIEKSDRHKNDYKK